MTKLDIKTTIIIGIVLFFVFSMLPDSKIDWLHKVHPNFIKKGATNE